MALSSARFEWNPQFIPQLESAVRKSLDDELLAAKSKAESLAGNTAAEVVITPAKRTIEGVEGAIYARKLRTIFEKGTKDRFTKSGAYRGRVDAQPAIGPAVDELLAKGLDINRYL